MTDRQILSGYIRKMINRGESSSITLADEDYELIADSLEEVDKLKNEITSMINESIVEKFVKNGR